MSYGYGVAAGIAYTEAQRTASQASYLTGRVAELERALQERDKEIKKLKEQLKNTCAELNTTEAL